MAKLADHASWSGTIGAGAGAGMALHLLSGTYPLWLIAMVFGAALAAGLAVASILFCATAAGRFLRRHAST